MRGRSFADVLDDTLHLRSEPAAVRGSSWRFTAPPPAPLPFPAAPLAGPQGRAAYRLAAGTGSPFAASFPHRRTVPSLTAPQQAAFAGLNALGARLAPDFAAGDLRTAYRRLAQDLHPDRHHGSSEADRTRRSRDFADATDHYKVLLTLFPRH